MLTIATATLQGPERDALERVVALLGERLGDDLLAVWLYGSRARGEVVPPDSDIDLVAITRAQIEWRTRDALKGEVREAAAAHGADPWTVSLQLVDRQRVAEYRAEGSFLMQEIDRDRIVLAGSEGGEIPGLAPFEGYAKQASGVGGMSPRSAFALEKAFDRLQAAERLFDEGEDRSAVASGAYYAMMFAAVPPSARPSEPRARTPGSGTASASST